MLLRNDVGQGPIRRELAFHASERYRCDRPVGSKGDNWSDASVLLDRCEECRPITVAHAEPRRRPKRGHNGEGRSDGRCYGFHRAIRSNDVRHPIDDHEFPIETVYGANSEIAVTQDGSELYRSAVGAVEQIGHEAHLNDGISETIVRSSLTREVEVNGGDETSVDDRVVHCQIVGCGRGTMEHGFYRHHH